MHLIKAIAVAVSLKTITIFLFVGLMNTPNIYLKSYYKINISDK